MVPTGQHRGTYNAQSQNNPEVAVVLDDTATNPRDIVIKKQDDSLTKISEFHPSYDSLQYPLLFPHGNNGYHINSPISCMKHYSYVLMVRKPTQQSTSRFQFSILHTGRGLFQQFLVDMGAKLISERLQYFRTHQDTIRAELYSTLREQAAAGGSLNDVGRAVRLPSSFFGGPRYMYNRQQDAYKAMKGISLANLVRTYGIRLSTDNGRVKIIFMLATIPFP